jgi:hypothetical protein
LPFEYCLYISVLLNMFFNFIPSQLIIVIKNEFIGHLFEVEVSILRGSFLLCSQAYIGILRLSSFNEICATQLYIKWWYYCYCGERHRCLKTKVWYMSLVYSVTMIGRWVVQNVRPFLVSFWILAKLVILGKWKLTWCLFSLFFFLSLSLSLFFFSLFGFLNFLFFGGTGSWTHCLMVVRLARQAVYHLSHSTSPVFFILSFSK